MKKVIVKSKKKAAPAKKKLTFSKSKAVAKAQNVVVRRPAVNATISINNVQVLINELDQTRQTLENYAEHMRALDRKRLNGVGVKKLGFIQEAYEYADMNQEFLPHWLPMLKFSADFRLFQLVRVMYDLNTQISELVWNIVMQTADMAYTDALEYYYSVQGAAKRRVDAAESIYNELKKFFSSRGKRPGDEPTEEEIRRDVCSILHGRKDGKIVLENISPKMIKGKKKFVDETYKSTSAFKEIDNGEIIQ